MTQEDRELLFKDLCARLPYAVKVKIGNNLYIVDGIDIGLNDEGEWVPRVCTHGITAVELVKMKEIEYCKPYLFPYSSMTEEQIKESLTTKHKINLASGKFMYVDSSKTVDFYCKYHIDFRGLIPKGLANDATGLNIY